MTTTVSGVHVPFDEQTLSVRVPSDVALTVSVLPINENATPLPLVVVIVYGALPFAICVLPDWPTASVSIEGLSERLPLLYPFVETVILPQMLSDCEHILN